MELISCPGCGSKFDVSTFAPDSDFECVNCRQVLRVPAPDVRRLLRCPGCSDPVDVTDMEPGSRLACGSCGATLVLPGGRPSAAAAPTRPPAPTPSTRPQPAPGRPAPARPKRPAAKARGRRPEPAAIPPRRPAAGADRPFRREPAPRRSAPARNTPLLLGLGGVGLAVIIVAIILVAGGGGGDEPETPVAKETPPPRIPDVPTDPAKMTRVQKLTVWRDKRLLAMSDDPQKAIPAWVRNHEWAVRYRMVPQAREALEAILKLDSQHAMANENLGRKLFRYRYGSVDDDMEAVPFEEKGRIIEALARGKDGQVWVSEEEYDELAALQMREKEHRERLESDPRYKWTKFWIGAVKLDPGYKGYSFEVNEKYPPYLVFVQDTGRKLDRELTEKIVRRNGLMFRSLQEQWVKAFEPEIRKVPEHRNFRFPPLGVTEGNSPPILKVWVFLSSKDFREYLARLGIPMGENVRAYYNLADQWITLYEGGGGEAMWFGRQTTNNGKVFHEGAHQLHRYYAKLVMTRVRLQRGDPPADFADVPRKAMWFSEGLAELFGGADEMVKDEKWVCLQPLQSRIWEYRMTLRVAAQGGGKPLVWKLHDLVQVQNNVEIVTKWIPRMTEQGRNPDVRNTLVSLFYAQAWTFCHYLWNADGGKHRPYFIRYLMKELVGEGGFVSLEPILKPLVDEAGGWDALDRKVVDYMNSLPAERPSRFRPR